MAKIHQLIFLTSIILAVSSVSDTRSESPPALNESTTYFLQTEPVIITDFVVTSTTNEVAIYPDVNKTPTLNALSSEIDYDILLATRVRPVGVKPELSGYGERGLIRNNGPPIT